MIQPRDLYFRLTKISDRYEKLKEIFDQFAQLATSQLSEEKNPFKGITFLQKLNKNYFDVCFAGKRVRFAFAIVEEPGGIFKGLVRCNPVGQDGKPLDIIIGEFTFNRETETSLRIADDDPNIYRLGAGCKLYRFDPFKLFI